MNTKLPLARLLFSLYVDAGEPAAQPETAVASGAPQCPDKKGFFSRLAFWKGDEDADASWQINLTGVGNRTELIVVNEDDEWEATNDAAHILALIRDRYPVN